MPAPPLPRLAPVIPAFQGLALAVLGFTLVNAAREIASPGASVAWHLFHVPGWPGGADACLALLSVLLVWSGFGPVGRRGVFGGLAAGLAALALLAGWNALEVAHLIRSGAIVTGWPVPLSAVLAGAVALHGALCLAPRHEAARAGARSSRGKPVAIAAAAIAGVGLATLLHIHAYGLTESRRPADAIVVFGARAYADGTPS